MVSPETLLEMAQPVQHHRTAEFRALFKECTELLSYVFQTTAQPMIVTGSGTAAMEAAILGCAKKDSRTLVMHAGKFGERWRDILKRFQLPYVEYQLDYGKGFTAEGVAEQFKANPDIRNVVMVHSETSTCAVSDLQGIAKVCRANDALLLVDGITAIGALPFKMDEWGIDVAVTGSQKALMLPPGLAFVAVNERAWKVVDSHQEPAYYTSLKQYRKGFPDGDLPYTPNNQMMLGLRHTLRQIQKEGIENVWKRTAMLAAGTRAAAAALNVQVFAETPADSVTGLVVPDGVDEAKWRKDLKADYGVHVAGGQGHLKGKMIRANHMGYVDLIDTVGLVVALELTLAKQNYKVATGSAATAFLKAIQS